MLKCYLAVRAERRAGARGCWVADMPFCVPPVRFRSRLHLLSFHVPAPAVHLCGVLPAPLRTDCHLYCSCGASFLDALQTRAARPLHEPPLCKIAAQSTLYERGTALGPQASKCSTSEQASKNTWPGPAPGTASVATNQPEAVRQKDNDRSFQRKSKRISQKNSGEVLPQGDV